MNTKNVFNKLTLLLLLFLTFQKTEIAYGRVFKCSLLTKKIVLAEPSSVQDLFTNPKKVVKYEFQNILNFIQHHSPFPEPIKFFLVKEMNKAKTLRGNIKINKFNKKIALLVQALNDYYSGNEMTVNTIKNTAISEINKLSSHKTIHLEKFIPTIRALSLNEISNAMVHGIFYRGIATAPINYDGQKTISLEQNFFTTFIKHDDFHNLRFHDRIEETVSSLKISAKKALKKLETFKMSTFDGILKNNIFNEHYRNIAQALFFTWVHEGAFFRPYSKLTRKDFIENLKYLKHKNSEDPYVTHVRNEFINRLNDPNDMNDHFEGRKVTKEELQKTIDLILNHLEGV